MPNTLARPPRRYGDSFSFSMRRSTAVGVAVSLLLHVAALIFIVPKVMKERELVLPTSRNPITAYLQPPRAAVPPAPTPTQEPQPAPPEPTPPQPRKPTPQRHRPPQRQTPATPPVLTQRTPSPRSSRIVPAPAAPPKKDFGPLPEPFPTPQNDDTPDMSATLEHDQKAREKREAQAGRPAGGNATPDAPDRDAAIAKNLARLVPTGTATFEIRGEGLVRATVHFSGWPNDPRSRFGEDFPVDVAGTGRSLEKAVIDTVIRRIRRDFDGDFEWESTRLGKIVPLSARPRDEPRLVAFLHQELFPPVR